MVEVARKAGSILGAPVCGLRHESNTDESRESAGSTVDEHCAESLDHVRSVA